MEVVLQGVGVGPGQGGQSQAHFAVNRMYQQQDITVSYPLLAFMQVHVILCDKSKIYYECNEHLHFACVARVIHYFAHVK